MMQFIFIVKAFMLLHRFHREVIKQAMALKNLNLQNKASNQSISDSCNPTTPRQNPLRI
jgi:hypothetical protein